MKKTDEIEIEQRIISFEKAKTNHKWIIMIAHNLHKLFILCFLRMSSENVVRPLTQFYEEIFKPHTVIESRLGRSIF